MKPTYFRRLRWFLLLCMLTAALLLCSCEIVLGESASAGNPGESAYEIAVRHGFVGTEEEWLASLRAESDTAQPTDPEAPAVGIATATVNESGHLILVMTDGTILDAGLVRGESTGGGDEVPQQPTIDEDGFRAVVETVYATNPVNVRTAPSTAAGSMVIGQLQEKETVTRIGIHDTLGWSRIVYNGKFCYVSSRYLELTVSDTVVDYGEESPTVNLMDSYTVTVGEPFSLCVDAFVLGLSSHMYPSFTYHGSDNATRQITPDTFTLTEVREGTYELDFTITMLRDGALVPIYGKTVEIVAVEKTADTSLVGMVLGDSRISDGTILSAMKMAFGGRLTLIGTKTAAGCPSEGRGGWSTSNYLNHASVGSTPNPFYNPARQLTDEETGIAHHFDFSYYMSSTGAEMPDFVAIHLGANDAYTAGSVENIKVIVNSIQAYGANVGKEIAVLVMTEYLYPSENYRVSYAINVPRMRYAQSNYFTYLKNAFSDREDEGIYLLPNYIVLNDLEDRVTKAVVSGTGTELEIYDLAHLGVAVYKKEAAVVLSYLYRIFGK